MTESNWEEMAKKIVEPLQVSRGVKCNHVMCNCNTIYHGAGKLKELIATFGKQQYEAGLAEGRLNTFNRDDGLSTTELSEYFKGRKSGIQEARSIIVNLSSDKFDLDLMLSNIDKLLEDK